MGASLHATIQRIRTYIQKFRRSIYNTRWPEHPHSPIHRYKRHPQGPHLHVPVVWNPSCTRTYSTLRQLLRIHLRSWNFCRHHQHHEHWTTASRASSSPHQISDASAIIGIGRSVLEAVSHWIQLTCSLIWLDSMVVFIWLDSIVVSIWLGSIIIIWFDSTHF